MTRTVTAHTCISQRHFGGKPELPFCGPDLTHQGSGLGAQREEVPGHQWGDAIGQGPIDQSLFCCVEN